MRVSAAFTTRYSEELDAPRDDMSPSTNERKRKVRSPPLDFRESSKYNFFNLEPSLDNTLGSLGTADLPTDVSQSSVTSNVVFEKIGRTSPAVGYGHLRLEVDFMSLFASIDIYDKVIRHTAKVQRSCVVENMLRNISAPHDFSCLPDKNFVWTRSNQINLSNHFKSLVGFRSEISAIRDIFRPFALLFEDYVQKKGPNAHWGEDVRAAFKELEKKGLFAGLLAGGLGAVLTNFLWSFFTPGESANAAHLAVLAKESISIAETAETSFSTVQELLTATEGLSLAIANKDEFDFVQGRLEFARGAISRRLQSVRSLLDAAASGHLSSSAYSLFDLREAVSEIRQQAKQLNMSPISKSFVEVMQSDVSLLESKLGFEIVIHMPLLRLNENGDVDQLDLYKFTDLPISLSPSLQLRVAPRSTQFLAISV